MGYFFSFFVIIYLKRGPLFRGVLSGVILIAEGPKIQEAGGRTRASTPANAEGQEVKPPSRTDS